MTSFRTCSFVRFCSKLWRQPVRLPDGAPALHSATGCQSRWSGCRGFAARRWHVEGLVWHQKVRMAACTYLGPPEVESAQC
jgi:hypothetical protein